MSVQPAPVLIAITVGFIGVGIIIAVLTTTCRCFGFLERKAVEHSSDDDVEGSPAIELEDRADKRRRLQKKPPRALQLATTGEYASFRLPPGRTQTVPSPYYPDSPESSHASPLTKSRVLDKPKTRCLTGPGPSADPSVDPSNSPIVWKEVKW